MDIRRALKEAAERAGISKRVYNHLLRHSFGTHATIAGVHPRSLQIMFGHASLKQVEIYSTIAAETVTAEGMKFANLVENNNKTRPVKRKGQKHAQ